MIARGYAVDNAPRVQECVRMSSEPQQTDGNLPRCGGRLPACDVIAAVAVGLLALVVVNIVPYVPTHDGPQHILNAHILNHYGDERYAYADYFRPATPVSSLGFLLLFAPLEDWLDWRIATRVLVSFMVLAWCSGAFALVRVLNRQRSLLGVAMFVLAFQWSLYMGFFSFLIATTFGLMTIALSLRWGSWTASRRGVLCAALLAQSLFHVFAAQITAVVLLCLVLVRSPWRRWPRELALLALMGAPTALVAAFAAGWIGSDVIAPSHDTGFSNDTVWERVLFLRAAFVGGPWWRAAPVIAAMSLGAATGLRRWIRKTSSAEERALLAAGLLLVLASLALPLHVPSWQFLSPRFLPLAAAVLIALVPLEALRTQTQRAAATIGVTAFTVASIVWAGGFHRDVDRSTRAAMAGLDQPIARRGPRLPIVLDAQSDWRTAPFAFYEPLLNLGALYAVQQGGIVPYAFTSLPQVHPFVWSEQGKQLFPPAPSRNPYARAWQDAVRKGDDHDLDVVVTRLAAFGARYADVILHSAGDEADRFIRRGYVADYRDGPLSIMRFEGCPTSVAVASPQAIPAAVLVEYGWMPVQELSWMAGVAPGTPPANGWLATAQIPTPCGDVWMRVFVDADRSGTLTRGDHVCAIADSTGKMIVTLDRSKPVVTCGVLRAW